MKVRFLGTGTSVGVPMVACRCEVCTSPNPKDRRLRSSVFVETEGTALLIDAGTDVRTQLLNYHIDDIDALLLTHYHKDHIAGLDDLRAITMIKKKAIPIYGKKDVLEAVQKEVPYAFGNSAYKLAPKFWLHEIFSQQNFMAAGVNVTPIEVIHGDLHITGFRIGNFSYITDASEVTTSEQEKLKGSTHLVVNGIRIKKHSSHFCLEEAIHFAKNINAPQVYITHISHQLGLHDEVNHSLPSNMQLAYDGLQIVV